VLPDKPAFGETARAMYKGKEMVFLPVQKKSVFKSPQNSGKESNEEQRFFVARWKIPPPFITEMPFWSQQYKWHNYICCGTLACQESN